MKKTVSVKIYEDDYRYFLNKKHKLNKRRGVRKVYFADLAHSMVEVDKRVS